MLGSVWNFVKRHKKKCIFAGVFVGGVVYLGKYASQKLQEYQANEAAACLEHARKQHHFDSNQRTCNMTVLSMMPTLRDALIRLLDTEQLTIQLKNRPENKLELWDELKVISFSRAILSVYSSCMLIVLLRVQLNIIGGYMYLDSLNSQNGMVSSSIALVSPDVQQRYLSLVQFLLNSGLQEFSEVVRAEVEFLLKDISLKQQISLRGVQDLVSRVRQKLEPPASGVCNATRSDLSTYLLPDEYIAENCNNPALLNKLMEETRDMLESEDFCTVLTTCLDTGFTRMLDKMAEHFRCPAEPGTSQLFHPTDMSMPLAKVIPIMSGLSHTVCAEAPNPFVQELLLKEQVKDFAANVYEAFSQPEQTSRA